MFYAGGIIELVKQECRGCMAVCHLTCLSNVSVPLTIHDMIMYISLVHTIHVF